jgi:hypothetical protein
VQRLKKQKFIDDDFGSSLGTAVPPSRPSLLSMPSEDYRNLRLELLSRLERKMDDLSPLVDELCHVEGGGVGRSDRHEVEDIVDCLLRMQSALKSLKGGG